MRPRRLGVADEECSYSFVDAFKPGLFNSGTGFSLFAASFPWNQVS